MDKFATLQTDIQNDAIPTCVCEKSLADKTEKFCLNCGVQLGGGVLQASGLLGGIGSVAVNGWKTEAIAAAIAAAEKTGAAAGLKAGDAAGMNVVIYYLKDWGIEQYCPDIFKSILKISHYSKVKDFAGDIVAKKAQICALTSSDENSMCLKFEIALRLRDAYGTPIAAPGKDPIVQLLNGLAEEAKLTADDVTKTISEKVTKAAIETSTGAIDAAKVMDNFNRQTQQRFHEYDERMVEKRMQCKDKCDKEIQKIILKDKIDKELTEKFATLQTDMQSDAIPTCVCEKSLADKVEKGCLRCGGVLGGGVAPGWGLISGIVYTGWKAAALAAATKEAIAEGAAKGAVAGAAAGKKFVIAELGKLHVSTLDGQPLVSYFATTEYTNVRNIALAIIKEYDPSSCISLISGSVPGSPPNPVKYGSFCNSMLDKLLDQGNVNPKSLEGSIQKAVEKIVTEAKSAAVSETANVTTRQTAVFESRNLAAVNATYASSQIAIIASIVAIVVIVLVM
ncbi:hypothetical protein PFUGPA_02697 [Plasmodium falciparum Palo Alto/Uganda]|uniref:Surface antigen n=1 Tax=Plasmodium falciparum (isolate Palo Alto / Uganda) TaxID=57270 RepID=W4IZ48_PLAFP|nr:hypothetical protein PFUGPA_02697 [Plasmodium falciparum Palo Alto/Uganda]